MYNSNYSQATFGSAARKTLKKPQGKSCGYYTRVILFFCSLIQTLIIISLVLFLIYGRSPDTAAEIRIQELEKSYTQVFMDNINLREQRKNLSLLLNSTQTQKMCMEKDLAKMRPLLDNSSAIIYYMTKLNSQCDQEKRMLQSERCKNCPPVSSYCFPQTNIKGPDKMEQLLLLQQYNFSRMVDAMKVELETTAKDRDTLNLETISLRREKNLLQTELHNYKGKCKEDFVKSLDGISNVTKAFLLKIDTLLPKHHPFLLTCVGQNDHFNQIRNNCTSLSREVETKFQHYLNNVGSQVSLIQAVSAKLEAEKAQLAEDHRWCSHNRSEMARENSETLRKTQEKNDVEKEKLLLNINKCRGDNVLHQVHIDILNSQIRDLNYSLVNCGFRPSMGNPAMPGTVNTNGAAGTRDFGFNVPVSNPFANSGAGGVVNRPSSTNPFGIDTDRTRSSSSSGLGLSVFGKVGTNGIGPGGAAGVGTSGIGGVGTSGIGGVGTSAIGGWGTSGGTGLGKVASGATQVVNRAPGGAGLSWSGSSPISSAGARPNGVMGTGSSNPFSQAAISQHLRDLQQFSNPKPKEVSG